MGWDPHHDLIRTDSFLRDCFAFSGGNGDAAGGTYDGTAQDEEMRASFENEVFLMRQLQVHTLTVPLQMLLVHAI